MRTFPKSLATFRKIVEKRGALLRNKAFDELKHMGNEPVEHLEVESRPATIGLIVQSMPDGSVRVVVQGFMKAWIGRNVALDGFHKHPDGTVTPMTSRELYQFD